MMKNKRGRELGNSPFSGCQICAAVFLLIHYMVIFDALIQRGFWVISKMTIVKKDGQVLRKLQEFENLKNQNIVLGEIKKLCIIF